jgi:hypothetical protein
LKLSPSGIAPNFFHASTIIAASATPAADLALVLAAPLPSTDLAKAKWLWPCAEEVAA